MSQALRQESGENGKQRQNSLDEKIREIPLREPILEEELGGGVVGYLDELETQGKIKKAAEGVYYRPKITRFGELGIDMDRWLEKVYIGEEGAEGYVIGCYLYNAWGLSTQVPWVKVVVTNKVKEEQKLGEIVILRPSSEPITRENTHIMQYLEVIASVENIQDSIRGVEKKLRGRYKQLTKVEQREIDKRIKALKKEKQKKVIESIRGAR